MGRTDPDYDVPCDEACDTCKEAVDAVHELMQQVVADDKRRDALEAFLAVADEVRDQVEQLHRHLGNLYDHAYEGKHPIPTVGDDIMALSERLRVLTDPAYAECAYGSSEPRSAMDLGGGLSVEGHWKRSPENDAAIADVVRAAADRVLGRCHLCRQRSHCVLPKGTPDCGAFAPDRRDASKPAVPPEGTERRRVAPTIAGILDYAPEAD